MTWKRSLSASLLFIVFGTGAMAGFFVPDDDDFFAIRKSFEIYGAVYEALVGDYVDPLDPNRLMRTGVEAMLNDLDPYTVFMNDAERIDMTLRSRGSYGSVGLELGRRAGKLTVIAPREQASAYKQGVRAGDVLLRIAGQPTTELTVKDARTLLRGDAGTTVEITVQREGRTEPLAFTLTRRQVDTENVSYTGFAEGDTSSGLGYVKLDRFGREAGQEVRRAVEQLQQSGPLEGLVLDLRDNPGGLLQEAVQVVQLFVPQGTKVVSMRGRAPESERVFRSKAPPLAPDLPLVILVNELSASASEIVAGAIQDLDRGVVVGTTTYGKGLVQTIKELPYNNALKMTLARYYTPSGRSIQARDYSRHDGTAAVIPDSLRKTYHTAGGRPVEGGNGIEPDVTAAPKQAGALEEALKRRASFFFFANAYAAEHDRLPADFKVTGELLSEFKAWLDGRDFSYQNEAQEKMDRLAQALEEAGYGLDEEVASLRRSIQQVKERDFQRHEQRLKRALRSEILARYLNEKEQIQALLAYDPQMQEALRFLKEKAAYRNVLE